MIKVIGGQEDIIDEILFIEGLARIKTVGKT